MHAWAVTVIAITGCAYQPSSFRFQGERFAGDHVRVGCLDLAIARRPDLDGAAVLAYRFGNRCGDAATIDLARVRVRGITEGGEEVALAPFDPKSELEPLRLDGRWAGAATWRCFDRPADEPDEIQRLVQQ